jgi:sugar lactone lactonase YvrE
MVEIRARRKLIGLAVILAVLLVGAAVPIRVARADDSPAAFPEVIPLPDGFQPEGIAIGQGTNFYVGSIPTGAIFHGDLRTGEGEILVPAQPGRAAIGLSFDERTNFLYVAGGSTGAGYIYDTRSGRTVAELQLTDPGTFVNDVVVTERGAFFTDSFRPVLYRVPLLKNGRLPRQPAVQEIPLSGDFVFVPDNFNTNGIEAIGDGRWLIIVNSARAELYRVNARSGRARLIDLHGDSVSNGDGLLLDGRTLYVVQNQLNQIAVVRLNRTFSAGRIVRTITDPDFRIPTTIDDFHQFLYAVNARFGVEEPEAADYEVVRVPKH